MILSDLPPEPISLIITTLPVIDLLNLSRVSSSFLVVCLDEAQRRLRRLGIRDVKNSLRNLRRIEWVTSSFEDEVWKIFQACLEETLREDETQVAEFMVRNFWSRVGGWDLILFQLAKYGQEHLIETLLTDPGFSPERLPHKIPFARGVTKYPRIGHLSQVLEGLIEANESETQLRMLRRTLEDWIPRYFILTSELLDDLLQEFVKLRSSILINELERFRIKSL